MPQVIKSPAAEEDMTDIWLFIAIENATAASRFLQDFEATTELIATQPQIGSPRPALGQNVRSHVFGNYVIFYRPVAQGIELVRVIHGARDIPDIFRRLP